MQYQKYRDTTLNELQNINICDNLTGHHEADILIIWWWVAGLHAALNLIWSGKKVILLERGLCGWGMSGRSWGFLTPDSELGIRQIENKYGSNLAGKIRSFAEDGQQSIVNNIKENNLNADLIEQDSMVLAYGRWWIESVKEENEVRLSHNLKSELLDQSQTYIYNTGKKYKWSVRYPWCYNINPMKYCQELKQYLVSQWIYIYENSQVHKIEKNHIYTNTWSIKFDKLIVAAWKVDNDLNSQKAKNTFGVHSFITISEILTDEQIKSMMPNDKTMCRDTQMVFTYYRITHDNRLLLGWGWEISSFIPFDYFSKIVIKPVISDMRKNFPILKDIDFPYYRSGRIQATKDLMPIIDFDTQYDNHIYIQGAVWLPWAASCGKFAVDMINDKHDKDLYEVYKSDRKFLIPFSSKYELFKSVIFWLSNAHAIMFE